MLLEAGAEVDCKNIEGKTPLHLASKNGKLEALKLLLAAGASTEVRDNDHKTPLDYATSEIMKPSTEAIIPMDLVWINNTEKYLSFVQKCLNEEREDQEFMEFLGEEATLFHLRKVGGKSLLKHIEENGQTMCLNDVGFHLRRHFHIIKVWPNIGCNVSQVRLKKLANITGAHKEQSHGSQMCKTTEHYSYSYEFTNHLIAIAISFQTCR